MRSSKYQFIRTIFRELKAICKQLTRGCCRTTNECNTLVQCTRTRETFPFWTEWVTVQRTSSLWGKLRNEIGLTYRHTQTETLICKFIINTFTSNVTFRKCQAHYAVLCSLLFSRYFEVRCLFGLMFPTWLVHSEYCNWILCSNTS